ncbi:hypothetical protein C8N46_11436 [Kordia periserrulae]|uniref:Uncharacterized protein n=1 Tax=Kordia periserrulae TaxID=701523 RepID=A0A2T6BQM4_9FLAO|nr:hypothetical protein [Kordia periserrulae]PTX58391.1 hypothetical protein C8N46_11436 [Kordia periserrulae]
MELKEITKSDFKISDYRNKTTVFEFDNSKYKLILGNLQEIRMSVYLYFDVKFFKNDKLILSGEMQEPNGYYELYSPNKKFVYIPLKGGQEIINLDSNQKLISSVDWFNGNIFNHASTKMIINGANEFKVIDLQQMKEIFHHKEEKEYLNDAFFVEDNLIWRFTPNGDIAELNLESKEQKIADIELPFSMFGIDLAKYKPLIDKKTHCLGLPKGGMAYSGNLNHWNYLNSKKKIVFETLVPTSDIKYSKGYERDYCNVEYKYVELIKRLPTTYKNKGGITAQTKDNNNNKLWSKLKRLWS